MMIFSITNVSN